LSGIDVALDLSVNGKLFDLGEAVDGEKFAAAGISRCGTAATAVAGLPPEASLYEAGPVAGCDGPLVSCFSRELKRESPPFAIGGHPTLKVFFYCGGGAVQMVGILLAQGRVIERDADVISDWFLREALKHLGPPLFEDSYHRVWRDSERELSVVKGDDLMVRWRLRSMVGSQP
jgi:hypothetical protein